ncbi:serine protease [Rugamonas sp. DEMB1]|jgi:V8-like Glu-specific endopeptidase|uniref:trypsin-like serine peptidase n=1 Tax=Rugamonas sp. DEMB1 TaxID=3039386 RepID=UPI002446E6FE|nr:trypsin-like serine protease [Rugamonas sp. DEMB1]WGG53037.1 trypsin-like serine protease [Rugamonas sp. DEMB1]
MKNKRAACDQVEAPLTIDQEIELGDQFGEPGWFDINRVRHPQTEPPKPAGCVALNVSMLSLERIHSIPDWSPENAQVMFGGPRSLPRASTTTRLRRFNGTLVEPANFTQIYDGESRQVYSTTSAPWIRVGQLITSLGGSGSAALVGKSTILTASHVVKRSWVPGGPVLGTVTFTPGMFNGTSVLGPTWTANVIGIAAWEQFVDQDGYDMAICQLDQPFGNWLGYFGYRTYDDDWEDMRVWTHAGYPYDLSRLGDRPCYEQGISVHDDDGDSYDTLELETRADIASGQSGGPLWGRWTNGGRQIIGTLSGREDNFLEEKNSLFAGGNGLSRLVRWGLDNWG